MTNAADDLQVRKRRREARERRKQEIEDLRILLAQPEGRRFVARMLRVTRVFHDSFTGNSATFYNEGRRAVGTEIMADVARADPDQFASLLREQVSREDEEQSND